MNDVLCLIIKLNIYIMLVLSANLTIGMARLLTMCQAAFYGIGAYIGTHFLIHFNLPFLVIVALVMLATGFFSFLISFASVRLKGDYFVIATMGFQIIVFNILNNCEPVTNGSQGIYEIPSIKLLGLYEISRINGHLILSTVTMIIVVLLFIQLVNSPFGRVLNAIRADELSTKALGRNTAKFKTWAFFLSAGIAGIAGVILASYQACIEPNVFTLNESIFIISALFIGGIGSYEGSVLGAAFVVLIPDVLRLIGLPKTEATSLQYIIYGLALILIMYFRPRGIWGNIELK